jgi:hypothetical protein
MSSRDEKNKPSDTAVASNSLGRQCLDLNTTGEQQKGKNMQQQVFASGHPPNY